MDQYERDLRAVFDQWHQDASAIAREYSIAEAYEELYRRVCATTDAYGRACAAAERERWAALFAGAGELSAALGATLPAAVYRNIVMEMRAATPPAAAQEARDG